MRISPFFERGFKPVSLYDKHRTSQPRTSGSLGPAKMELSQNVRRQQYFHDNLDIFDGPVGSVIKKNIFSLPCDGQWHSATSPFVLAALPTGHQD